ncbi:MAG: DUF6895 family protein [bacterium]
MYYRMLRRWLLAVCIIAVLSAGCATVHTCNYREIVGECSGKTKEDEVICRGLGWLFEHPVDIEKDGFLELGEEINLFYKLYLKAEDRRERKFFHSLLESKVDYLLTEHDLKVDFAGEVTGYLNFAKIMKRMEIKRPGYDRFIQEEILPNPMTYPPNITYTILNSALVEDIGATPRVNFGNLVSQGVIARFTSQPGLMPIGKAYASDNDIMNFFYDITHEVFAVSNFGDRDPRQYLLDDEIQFLRSLIPQGIAKYLEDGQVDILGELIICAKMIEYTNFHNYEEGIQYILNAQKEDGSFGRIERMAFLGRPNLYRHGVLVSLWALVE